MISAVDHEGGRPDDSDEGARRRYEERLRHDETDQGMYDELQRLRGIVDGMEGGGGGGGGTVSFKLSLNNSAMSMMFGFLLAVIVTVTVYAFANLYWALCKRFSVVHEEL